MNLTLHLAMRLLFIVVFAQIPFTAHAQNKQNSSEQIENRVDAFDNKADIESTDRMIAVDDLAGDEQIASRLNAILTSSQKYTDVKVNAQEGLVFIAGIADDEKYINWASDIAKNIEGVVGVVNNLQMAKVDYFTLEPIKAEFLNLYFRTISILPLVILGFLVFTLFFFVSRPLSNWFISPISYLTESLLIQTVVKRFIALFIILIGLYFFLRIAGLTQFALAVISGTGMLGLVLGFAFRDIAENFISSLLISVQRPFRLGDVIEVSSHKGVVRKVTARGTTLVDYDGNHIQIPNAVIYKNIIQNFSANPYVRGHFIIGVGYDASIKLAQELAMQLMLNHKAVINDPEPQVLVDNLGSSTVNLKIYFWIDSHIYSVAKVASILMRQIMREFEANGLSMPDDAREIIFPQGVPVVMPSNDSETNNKTSQKHSNDNSQLENAKQIDSIKADKEMNENDLTDDLSADTDDIRQQADRARDPEEGSNII